MPSASSNRATILACGQRVERNESRVTEPRFGEVSAS
jgi:hypothetical protein